MFEHKLYEWLIAKGLEAKTIAFLGLLMIIFLMIQFIFFIQSEEKRELAHKKVHDFPLCPHCKYRQMNHDKKFMLACYRYEPKSHIRLRKQTQCPVENVWDSHRKLTNSSNAARIKSSDRNQRLPETDNYTDAH